MTIDFTCQKCDGAFDMESAEIVDGTEKIECPHCHAKAASAVAEDFASALSELAAQVALLSRKFAVSFSVDSEELAAAEEAEEEEDEDVESDEDEDDDELEDEVADDTDEGDEGRF